MNITTYNLLQNAEQHPTLAEESEHYYFADALSTPQEVTAMLNDVFKTDQKCEEYMYMIAINAQNKVLGVFEISHGTQSFTYIDPRSVYTRAMLCGAAGIILAHNHPAGGLKPSKDDVKVCKRIYDAGELMGICLLDFLVLGKQNEFFSFAREGLFSSND